MSYDYIVIIALYLLDTLFFDKRNIEFGPVNLTLNSALPQCPRQGKIMGV